MQIETVAGPAQVEVDEVAAPKFLLVLTHGAGGGVASADLMAARQAGLDTGGTVVRVLQPYRVAGARAPGSAQRQDAAWLDIITALRARYSGIPLVQGGRSNGARLACRTAQATGAAAVIALAFPLHPPGKADVPEKSRAGELRSAGVPVLVINGDRDPFGVPDAADADRLVVLRGETHSLSKQRAAIGNAIASWLSALGWGDSAPGVNCRQAAGTRGVGLVNLMSVGRCGATAAPVGSSSPVSSNTTMPLQSRLQPCSGWLIRVRAASWSGSLAAGHGGVCGHIARLLIN